MKTHGQNSPQTIRGMRERRSLRGLLDTRRFAESDLRDVDYVAPFGRGFHLVRNPGGTSSFIIADQTGGRTFAPHTSVLSGSSSGKPGEVLLGGAPAGKKGGISRSANRRRRGEVAAESNQFAFGFSGSDMVATLYYDGTYVSTRGSIAAPGTAFFTGCIVTDTSLVVGDGSALLKDGDTLYVWDVDGAATHSYSVPAGWIYATQLYYQNGFLYWCEMEDVSLATTFDVRLRKSDTDLGNVSTLSTFTSPDAVADYGVPWTQWQNEAIPLAFAVDDDGAVLYVESVVWDEQDSSDWHGLQIRFALSGANAFREFDTPELGVDGINLLTPVEPFPCATLATTFAIAEPIAATQSVLSKDDDSSTTAANLWGASDLDGITVSAFGVGSGLSTLQVHDAVNGKIIRGIASGSIVTSAIDAFDLTPNYPSAMFYSGV